MYERLTHGIFKVSNFGIFRDQNLVDKKIQNVSNLNIKMPQLQGGVRLK